MGSEGGFSSASSDGSDSSPELREQARSADFTTVSKSTVEARSLLDGVAPWVPLGCSSSSSSSSSSASSSSSGASGSKGGAAGGGKRGSAARLQQELRAGLRAVEECVGRQLSVPILSRYALPTAGTDELAHQCHPFCGLCRGLVKGAGGGGQGREGGRGLWGLLRARAVCCVVFVGVSAGFVSPGLGT